MFQRQDVPGVETEDSFQAEFEKPQYLVSWNDTIERADLAETFPKIDNLLHRMIVFGWYAVNWKNIYVDSP